MATLRLPERSTSQQAAPCSGRVVSAHQVSQANATDALPELPAAASSSAALSAAAQASQNVHHTQSTVSATLGWACKIITQVHAGGVRRGAEGPRAPAARCFPSPPCPAYQAHRALSGTSK